MPRLLEGAAEHQDICDVISRVLDSMHTAELPRELHLKDLIKQEMAKRFAHTIEKKWIGPAEIPPHEPSQNNTDWNSNAHSNCLATNIHRHSFTCHKGVSGCHGCRLARPFGLCQKTGPSILKDHENQDLYPSDPTVSFSYNFKGEEVLGQHCQAIDPKISHKERDITTHPLPPPDERVLVWELRRPELPPLPTIPDHMDVDASDTKQFCIEELMQALSHNGTIPEETLAPVRCWLTEDLKPHQVVKVYEHIAENLPMRNGLVTEHNDTLLNTTGSAINSAALLWDVFPRGAELMALPVVLRSVSLCSVTSPFLMGKFSAMCS